MAGQADCDATRLFRASMADVTPLKHDKIEPFQRRAPPRCIRQPYSAKSYGSVDLSEASVMTEDFLEFVRPGVQTQLLLQLRQGRLEPQLELDLHGLTVVYAQENLDKFLLECRRRSLRCVRLIHGKGTRSDGGQPVLKCKVNYWLRCYPEVLAFTSAPSWAGGTGALYVLLRNSRKSHRVGKH